MAHSSYSAELVEARLLEAGRTLMALHVPGTRPAGVRSNMPEYVRDLQESYGWGEVETRPGPPSPRDIQAMDQAYSWVRLLPADRVVFRKIVLARSLCRPHQDRPLLSWRRIGVQLGASYEAVRVWHGQAIGMIVDALNRPGLCAVSGGPMGPPVGDVDRAVRRALERPGSTRPMRMRVLA